MADILFPAQYDMRRAMNAFGVAVASGPIDLRVRHISALSMMLEVKDEVEVMIHLFSSINL